MTMMFSNISDGSLTALYEDVRTQVTADAIDDRYRLIGERAKDYAEVLRKELVRRGLRFEPIRWH
ncbi:hypothetical protein [Bradyrhizobium sp. CCBAU 53380]|uniref:hypothetical protein n=1 Tax=Bradyrhizobium sp. CCBAU 53380 TaxID=1325117 RepID=UPI0023024702|nr:hypothetical protein [Bradyrhizobium sp. CCBAU 53380]